MRNKLTVIIFCGALLVMALLLLLLPPGEFSEKEKRYLAGAPELTADTLFSGEFGEKAETYAADHLPARDLLIGINAGLDKLALRQTVKDIYVGNDGRLFERPVTADPQELREKLEQINDFADILGREVDFILVPSAGYILRDDIGGLADSYRDRDIIYLTREFCGDKINFINLVSLFENEPDPGALYYRTDHHWTSRGAYLAACEYLSQKGRTVPREQDFTVETAEGFYGTTYSRSALWLTDSESIELWRGKGSFTVTNSDDRLPHEGLFYTEHLSEADKYPVYLGGNHPLIRIENSNPDAEGSILIIRDSYSSCLAGFLAESYKTVVLADLRYYKQPLSKLCEEEGFDDVAVIYSLGNFVSDENIWWLE